MPLAVQYGMPINEFWYGDTRLLGVYQKAYIRNQSYNSWLNGYNNSQAFLIAMANAFKKEGAKSVEYPVWHDPIPKSPVPKDVQEKKFRDSQISQNIWLHNMINNK